MQAMDKRKTSREPHSIWPVLTKKWPQHIPRDAQRALPPFERLAERVVLDLDAHGATVARLYQRAHEPAPVHLAVARNARLMPLQRMREHAHVVDPVAAHLDVLRVHVKQLVLKLAQR